jgi:hypothetical protein
MEHEKEHHHAEATKRVDERREERDRRNQATQQIAQVEDESPHQKSRHQNRSDQCQQRRIFECHGRSMNVAGVWQQTKGSTNRIQLHDDRDQRNILGWVHCLKFDSAALDCSGCAETNHECRLFQTDAVIGEPT